MPSFRKCPQHDDAPSRSHEGLCAESEDFILKVLKQSEGTYSIVADLYSQEQIQHKAACKSDYNKVIVLAAIAERRRNQHSLLSHPKHLINPNSYDLYLQIQTTFYASLAPVY